MEGSAPRESQKSDRAQRSKRGQRTRHAWNRKGSWNGSRDVRTCRICDLVVYKTGLYGGYQTRQKSEPETSEIYREKMPPCPGGPTTRATTTEGKGDHR